MTSGSTRSCRASVLRCLIARPTSYLPRSVAYLPATPILRRMMADAGYSGVGIRPLAGGLSQLLYATRVGSRAP